MPETHIGSLGWEDPWTEEPGKLQPIDSQESDTNAYTNCFVHYNQASCWTHLSSNNFDSLGLAEQFLFNSCTVFPTLWNGQNLQNCVGN